MCSVDHVRVREIYMQHVIDRSPAAWDFDTSHVPYTHRGGVSWFVGGHVPAPAFKVPNERGRRVPSECARAARTASATDRGRRAAGRRRGWGPSTGNAAPNRQHSVPSRVASMVKSDPGTRRPMAVTHRGRSIWNTHTRHAAAAYAVSVYGIAWQAEPPMAPPSFIRSLRWA